jgi:hypothetical protein
VRAERCERTHLSERALLGECTLGLERALLFEAPGLKSEPHDERAPTRRSEPSHLSAPELVSEPRPLIAPRDWSEPNSVRGPRQTSEPKVKVSTDVDERVRSSVGTLRAERAL